MRMASCSRLAARSESRRAFASATRVVIASTTSGVSSISSPPGQRVRLTIPACLAQRASMRSFPSWVVDRKAVVAGRPQAWARVA